MTYDDMVNPKELMIFEHNGMKNEITITPDGLREKAEELYKFVLKKFFDIG